MSQAPTNSRDLAFDGRIQLNGDAAPELEVILELDDQFIVLGHSSGELGRWDRTTVRVSPIGRGWFTLDVEDETVTFLPRRPGHFAASTVDLLPVEVVAKRWWQRRDREQKKPSDVPALSRRERKRLKREQASRAAAAQPVEVAPDVEPREPAPPPIEQAAPSVDPTPVEAAIETPEPGPTIEPASPWDEEPVPELPGDKARHKKRRPSAPAALPVHSKPPRQKKPKAPKAPRGEPIQMKAARTVTPAGPKQKSAFSRGMAGFRHGVKGMAWRISDELRQTGIVPFDRLPSAPARSKPSEDHKHNFQEHRLPGGLTRNVCHSCGLVSIGEHNGDD